MTDTVLNFIDFELFKWNSQFKQQIKLIKCLLTESSQVVKFLIFWQICCKDFCQILTDVYFNLENIFVHLTKLNKNFFFLSSDFSYWQICLDFNRFVLNFDNWELIFHQFRQQSDNIGKFRNFKFEVEQISSKFWQIWNILMWWKK